MKTGHNEQASNSTTNHKCMLWTQRGESPPSFCNGLGTIYITSFKEEPFELTTRDMGSEFRYALGR